MYKNKNSSAGSKGHGVGNFEGKRNHHSAGSMFSMPLKGMFVSKYNECAPGKGGAGGKVT